MKKFMAVALALVTGCLALEAEDLVSLGIYFSGGSVELVGQTPKVAYRSRNVEEKNGSVSFPCYINIDSPKSAELKFKATGDVTFFASLYAFRKGAGTIVPLMCTRFDYNGKSIPGIPCEIRKWKRMLTRKLKDGETFTISLSLEKAEE